MDVKINRKAISQLLKSSEVSADLRRRAGQIASAAGAGHKPSVQTGRTRARATVITTTTEARVAQATDRNLSNAITAGR
jgi:hypothetical protein